MRYGVVSESSLGRADSPAVFAYRTFTPNLLVGQGSRSHRRKPSSSEFAVNRVHQNPVLSARA